MSRLRVDLNYIKVAQYIKCIRHFADKLEKELDEGVTEANDRTKLADYLDREVRNE